MARLSNLEKRDRRISALIFGEGATACTLASLSYYTGIPAPTLSRYRKRPGTIPLDKLQSICRARHIAEETQIKILKG